MGLCSLGKNGAKTFTILARSQSPQIQAERQLLENDDDHKHCCECRVPSPGPAAKMSVHGMAAILTLVHILHCLCDNDQQLAS